MSHRVYTGLIYVCVCSKEEVSFAPTSSWEGEKRKNCLGYLEGVREVKLKNNTLVYS